MQFHISFYYQQNKWHSLIKLLLQSIIEESKRDNFCSIGILNFSSNRGDNVGLTISYRGNAEESLINFISTSSKIYFKNNPCKKNIANTPTLFRGFTYNSFYYNLSNFHYTQILELAEHNLFEFITYIIIEELANGIIDDEIILTYYLYIQTIFLKSFLHNYSDITLPEKLLFAEQISKSSHYLPNKFILENENHLRDVIKNILTSKVYFPDESKWMKDWYRLSCSVFDKNKSLIIRERYKKYSDLSMYILEQFGINENLGRAIFTFINQVGICNEF